MSEILLQLIQNSHTGKASSTRVGMFIMITLAALLIIACIVVMLVDVCKAGRIQTDYFTGIAAIVTAAAAIIASVSIPKAMSDKYQQKKKE